jgi:hypothetical protein
MNKLFAKVLSSTCVFTPPIIYLTPWHNSNAKTTTLPVERVLLHSILIYDTSSPVQPQLQRHSKTKFSSPNLSNSSPFLGHFVCIYYLVVSAENEPAMSLITVRDVTLRVRCNSTSWSASSITFYYRPSCPSYASKTSLSGFVGRSGGAIFVLLLCPVLDFRQRLIRAHLSSDHERL